VKVRTTMTAEQDSFYITLASDASLAQNPDNVASSFSVSLPKEFNLKGPWEVALTELHFMHTIHNITTGNNRLVYKFNRFPPSGDAETVNVSIDIPPGHYRSIDDVIDTLNRLINNNLGSHATSTVMFNISTTSGKVECNKSVLDNFMTITNDRHNVTKLPLSPIRLYLEGTLAILLGYNPYTNNLLKELNSENLPSLSFGISTKLFVYCDILAPQIIGHKFAKVLKICPTLDNNVQYGGTISRRFNVAQYIDVMTKNFDKIRIDLRGNTGKLIPFAFGPVYLLLHFRPKSQ
jgi:hypothetical protein